MLTLGTTGRIWLAVEPVDARKSFDTLAGVVAAGLGRDPVSGDVFVFRNRRGHCLLLLAWDGDGYVLVRKRLERGTFAFPAAGTADVPATPAELALILAGLDLADTTKRMRYARPAPTPA